MAKHQSNVYTVLLLAAFLALAGATAIVWYKLTKDYELTPRQILGLEPLPEPGKRPGTSPGGAPGAPGSRSPTPWAEPAALFACDGGALEPAAADKS
jgi:hypothetical protein